MAQQKTPEENDAEKTVRDYQMTQEQLRATSLQLDQLQLQKAELARAKEEVSASGGKVYVTVGGVIVETGKDKALADIKEKSELADVRIGSFTKQLNDLKSKEKQLGEKITQMYKQSQGVG
ncbi:MAG: prefoldin subunit [Candidatus Marsarchaeota archaeon]|nr:prefoldin subunit [Candidatus Marsarchaeota archaeon]